MTEKSIFESANIFKELIDNISDGVAVYEAYNNGEGFIFKDINKTGEKISNVKRKDVIGKFLSEIFPGVKEFGLFNVFQKVWNTGKSQEHPVLMYKDERISRYVKNYVYKSSSGLIIAIYEDVSEQRKINEKLEASEGELLRLNKELEQEVRKRTYTLNQLIELNPYAIALYDPKGSFIRCNQAFIKYFKAQPPKEYTIFEDPILKKMGILGEINVKIKNGEIINVPEMWYNPKDLSPELPDINICFRTTIFSIFNDSGKIENIVLIFDDVTENANTEKKLKDSEEKYRKSYFQANLYKDIFAHDINNILQNIHSSVELSSLYINSPEKLHTIKELYEIINEQVNRGSKLIKNIKKITEIDETEVELEKINAILELNKAIEFTKANFPNRNLNIKFKTTIKRMYILANKLLLDVFENILINAVRHNDKSNIRIKIEVSEEIVEDKSYFKIEFKDNGLGISDYRKKDIFEKGTRTTQKSKGMGLGLSLVKKIIDSYHGDILIEDRVKGDHKQGCNFVVHLENAE